MHLDPSHSLYFTHINLELCQTLPFSIQNFTFEQISNNIMFLNKRDIGLQLNENTASWDVCELSSVYAAFRMTNKNFEPGTIGTINSQKRTQPLFNNVLHWRCFGVFIVNFESQKLYFALINTDHQNWTEAYSEPSQTSKMELFYENKSFIVNTRLSSKYASAAITILELLIKYLLSTNT